MNIKKTIHLCDNLQDSKEVVERLLWENMEHKISSYVKKFDHKEDAEWDIELKLEKNSRWLFDWKLQIQLDKNSFRYEREDYKNLDDLINHLFKHFKEEASAK